MQLDGVVRLGRRDVGLVELDRRAGESLVGVAALALQRLRGPNVVDHFVGLVVRLEVGVDVRLLLRVGRADGIGGGFGALERVRDGERDVLAVVANDVVFERRPALVDDAFESRPQGRAEDLSDVLAMKDRAHAGHLLGRRRVELDHPAVGDRRLDRHGIEHPGKVEVGGVLRRSGDFQRAVHARRVAADREMRSGAACVVGMRRSVG